MKGLKIEINVSNNIKASLPILFSGVTDCTSVLAEHPLVPVSGIQIFHHIRDDMS